MPIRPARLEDTLALAGMVRAEAEHQLKAGADFRLAKDADWAAYASHRLQRPHGQILVAELNGALVGFVDVRVAGKGAASVTAKQPPRGMLRRLLVGWRRSRGRATAGQAELVEASSAGMIDGIYVVPEYRNRGIATDLLRRGMAWLEDRQVGEIEGAIWAGNDVSFALFRKAGFETARVLVRRKVPGGSLIGGAAAGSGKGDQVEKGA